MFFLRLGVVFCCFCSLIVKRHQEDETKEQKERDFERLVEEQRQTIYSVCYLFASDRQQADDLVQEVLIRLWRGIDGFKGRSSAKTWGYRVALNTCVTLDKRHRRRPDSIGFL